MIKEKKLKFPSELRSDPLSRDWVIIATGRGKRPDAFKREKRGRVVPLQKDCPFCGMVKKKKGSVLVVDNKYPALIPSSFLNEIKTGPYRRMDGVGYHQVVITRDHQKSLGQLSAKEVQEVIDIYQERYLDLMHKPLVKYVSIFHNHGAEAGASIFHPHSQIIAAPVIDPDLHRAVLSSQNYYQQKKKCLYCVMNSWEKEVRKRVVFENKMFLVVCPFASKSAFEMIISPKKHLPYFERINQEEKKYLAEAFWQALSKLYKALGDPAYNFYLHTAPCDGKNYNFYHWHWTILPKTAAWAGFELCTGIEISTIEPEKAAEYLRHQ